ncbi:MAG TPA: ABC transporter permease [bacterium]|nr:ABC transporter permease [bacterium]
MSENPINLAERVARATEGVFDLVLPRRAAALARKEARHIVRDPYTLSMNIVLPLMMMLLFGYAISFEPHDLALAVLDQDHSQDSRKVVQAIQGSGFFKVQASGGEPEKDVESERVKATLVIPRGFQLSVGRGEDPQLQVLMDGSDNAAASVVQGYLSGVVNSAWDRLEEERGYKAPPQPLEFNTRYLFNPELDGHWFIVPGLLVVILGLLCVLLTALTVAREWEQGSMELLLSTPIKPMDIILGKVAPYVGLGLLDVGIVYVVARLVFHVPFAGSHVLFLVGSFLFLLVALSQGLLISVTARNQQVAFQMSMMMGMLPTMLLSGFIFPIESMPWVFRVFTSILPPRWFMTVVRGLFLKGANLSQLALPFGVLTLMALLLTTLAIRRFKTDVEP